MSTHPSSSRPARERGAAAVEFAIVAVLLLTMLLGIMEYGRAWAIQGALSQASRDAARTAAINNNAAAGELKLEDAFRPLGMEYDGTLTETRPTQVGTPGAASCEWQVSPRYEFPSLTGFFGADLTVSATGAMRCNG